MTTPENRAEHRAALVAAGAIADDSTTDQTEDGLTIPNRWIPTPRVRSWLYGIIAAVVPLLVVLGVITSDVGGHVLTIAGAVLAVGGSTLALVNTPKG